MVKGGTPHTDLIELLPLEYVFLVELADGTIETPGSFAEDAVFGRLDPGEGELDVQGFIAALHRAGYRGIGAWRSCPTHIAPRPSTRPSPRHIPQPSGRSTAQQQITEVAY